MQYTQSVYNVNWTDTVIFEVAYNDLNHSVSVTGATVTNSSWADNIRVKYNATTGHYLIYIGTNVRPDNYTLTFTFTKQNYVQQSVTIHVNVLIPLRINTQIPEFSSSVYWLDNYTLYIKLVNAYDNSTIPDAIVNLTWSGTLGQVTLHYNATAGLYYYEFNSTIAGTPGIYNLNLAAYRHGSTTAEKTIYLNVKELPTTISLYNPKAIRLYYADVETIAVYWRETYHVASVTSADVATVDIYMGEVYLTTLNLSEISPGNYSFTLDTVNLGLNAGYSYTFVVTLSKNGYSTPAQIVYSVTVAITPTDMTINIPANIYWTQNTTITVSFIDTIHNVSVPNANVTVSIGNVNYTLQFDSTTGNYYLVLNSTDFTAGTYTVKVNAIKQNYDMQYDALTFTIKPVPTELVLLTNETAFDILLGTDNITITVKYIDTLNNKPIIGANVTITVVNETFEFTEIAPGTYRVVIKTANYTVSKYSIIIHAEKPNYTPAEITNKVITVKEAVIVIPGTSIAIPVSSVYNIGGGALAAVAFVGVGLYSYRIYKIPWIIRYLDKTIKLLLKGKSVDFSKFPTLEETLNEALSPYFESIGSIPKMEKD